MRTLLNVGLERFDAARFPLRTAHAVYEMTTGRAFAQVELFPRASSSESMKWIALGFLLIHLLLLFVVFVALMHTLRGRRSKKADDREEHIAHPTSRGAENRG